MIERIDLLGHSVWVRVHDEFESDLSRHAIPERDHLSKFPGRIDVQERERNAAWMERLLGEAQHRR